MQPDAREGEERQQPFENNLANELLDLPDSYTTIKATSINPKSIEVKPKA